MTIIVILALALLALAFLLWVVRGQALEIRELSDLEGRTQPVDLAAFRNLTDPSEAAYLRAHLPPREFKAVQRQRTLATLEYVRRVNHNAAIVLRLGEMARHQESTELAEAARRLVETAIQLRLNVLFVVCRLCLAFLVPGITVPRSFPESYERVVSLVADVTRLQRPALAGRIAALF